MPNIVILDGYTVNPGDLSWDGIAAQGNLTVYDRTPADKIVERIGDAEAIFTNKCVITAEILDACPNLKFVGELATGYNNIDVAAAKERGVVVSNIPAYSTDSVVQMTFALLLEACHHVGAHTDAVHGGEWTASPDFSFWKFPLIELAGKTLGVIGFGRIGQGVAKVARAFGMNVLAYGPRYKPEMDENGCKAATLDELLNNSDVISVNCPLFPETKELIRKENIDKMKDGVILVNTSRGAMLNDADVRAALESGKIGYLCTDVATVEPIPADSPLLGAPNTLITPHIAWAPKEARMRLMAIAENNLRGYLAGEPINRVG
ncbi:MAG: D-2-hydroxyacid dehydrogenase [Clostridia bacterium]|nr:D-2-hydroxyacid dehydrogenase [Clostridia bacterium]